MRLTKKLFFLRPIAKKIYELLDRQENKNIPFAKKQLQELKEKLKCNMVNTTQFLNTSAEFWKI